MAGWSTEQTLPARASAHQVRLQGVRAASNGKVFTLLLDAHRDCNLLPRVFRHIGGRVDKLGRIAAGQKWRAVAIGVGLAALVCLAYGPAQALPLISDDYLHIWLARQYGPPEGWARLFADPLYRCRAVSLVHAWLIDLWFGPTPIPFNLSSLFLHWGNCVLVAALGCWRLVGWRVSVPAAAFFAVHQGHQEAVVWFAASPELEVFAFLLGAILCWIMWLRPGSRKWPWYVGCFAAFLLALISKESGAILPALLALILAVERERDWRRSAAILPFLVVSGLYFWAGYVNRGQHLHYNDGTFAIGAPFWTTMPLSIFRMLWGVGLASIAVLALWRRKALAWLLALTIGWMAISLLPYSFLTYMSRVPSRHTYIAAAGLALLVGWAAAVTWEKAARRHRSLAVAAAILIVLANTAYLWTRKHQQYVERARPTEEIRRKLAAGDGPVRVCGFPYSPGIAESVVVLSGSPRDRLQLVSGPDCTAE